MNKIFLKDYINIETGSMNVQDKIEGGLYPFYSRNKEVFMVNEYTHDKEAVIVAGEGDFTPKYASGKFALHQRAYALSSINTELLDNKYLYYLMHTQIENLKRNSVGTTVPSLRRFSFENLCIELKDIETQRKIANYLSNLDNQIELNNKINQELEEMAQTLYNYWFIQFEFPNEEGKPYKSSGGEMVWNEELKREVPAGWEVKKLSDLLIKNNCKIKEKKEWENEKLIDLSNMPSFNMCLNEYDLGSKLNSNIYKMNEYDILFGSIRPYLGKAGFAPFNGVTTGTVHSFSVKKDIYYSFSLMLLTRKDFFDYAVSRCKGSKMPVIGIDDILDYKVALPIDDGVLKTFNDAVFEFIQTMKNNIIQNQELAHLRDFMLPLLMNGQVTIED